MFGQPSSTPFGGGGFGQQQQQQQPAFGSQPATGFGAAPSQSPFGQQQQQQPQQQSGFGGGFGQPNTGFGQPTSSSPFGAAAAPTGGFGQPQQQQQNQPFGGGSTFGSPAPAPGGGIFGSGNTGSTFGNTAGTGAFGTSTSTGGGLFGSAPTPAGGGGLFGSTPAANTTPFGGTPTSFGSNTTTFGSTGGSTFGGSNTTPSFGAATPAAPFAAPQASGGIFGNAPAPAGGGLFGAAPQTGGGLFSTTPGQQQQQQPGQQGPGTRNVPFQPTNKPDGANASASITLQSISAMPQYENYMFEELRVQDYMQGNRGTSTPTTSNTGGFGVASPAPAAFGSQQTGSLFGSSAATPAAPAFGGSGFASAPAPAGGNLFGSSPAPFAAPQPSGGLFGSAPVATAPAPFAAPQASGGLFGSAPAPAASGGLFGSTTPAPGPAFGGFGGAAPAPAPFSAPAQAPAATGGLFGSSPAPAPGGLFSSTAPAPFGAPAQQASSFGGFGAKPAGTGLFGSPPASAPAFGFGAAQPAPATGGLFGTSPAAPQPPSLFGAPQPQQQQTSLFGASSMQQQPQQQPYLQPGMPNAHIVPPVYGAVLEQQLKVLDAEKQKMEKTSVWRGGASASPSAPTTPTNVGGSISIMPISVGGEGHYSSFASPRSSARIRPRGFPKTEPTNKNNNNIKSMGFSGNIGTSTPEAHLRSSATRLVIRPDSLSRQPLRLQLQQQPKQDNNISNGRQASSPATATTPTPTPSLPAETLTSPPHDDLMPTMADGRAATDPVRASTATSPRGRTAEGIAAVSNNTPASAGATPADGSELPTTSPGYDYYQRVIGSGMENGDHTSGPISSPGASNAPNKSVPKLTKPGYDVFPSMEELSKMSEADLATVSKFSVMRQGYGKVEWDGSVDVRGADLDTIVDIQHADIAVYAAEEDEGTKPPEGTKLNRPAKLTFYGVFPGKKGITPTPDEVDKMHRKLEKSAQKNGSEFTSYDSQVGEWKIHVEHFSRYRIEDDSDDDDDEQDSAERQRNKIASPPTRRVRVQSPDRSAVQVKQPISQRRKATPFKPSRIMLEEEVSESMDYEEWDGAEDEGSTGEDQAEEGIGQDVTTNVIMTESAIIDEVSAKADYAFKEVFGALQNQEMEMTQERSQAFQKLRAAATCVTFEEDGEEAESDLIDETLASAREFAASITEEQEATVSSSVPSITEACLRKAQVVPGTGNNATSVDMGLRMGRSFRVGWLPNGSFLKLESDSCNGTRTLIKCRPAFSDDDNSMTVTSTINDDPRKLLEIHKKYSRSVPAAGNECSLITLSPASAEDNSTPASNQVLRSALTDYSMKVAPINQDASPAFLLLSALLDIDNTNSFPKDSQYVSAVTSLLIDICSSDVSEEIKDAMLQNNPQAAVFAALSGADLERACDIATESGLFSLATLLSTTGSADGKKDTLRQILHLIDAGTKMSPTLERNLKAVSGDTNSENDLYRKGSSSLDWRRRLALRLLQNPDCALAQAVKQYESDLCNEMVPFPAPRYVKAKTTKSANARSGLFLVLQSSADPGSVPASAVLDPRGYTASEHDYGLSFHLASAISAASEPLSGPDAFTYEYVCDAYESQLISSGFWEWAVYVAFCCLGGGEKGKGIPDNVSRAKIARAKELVVRNFNEADPFSDSRRSFLEKQVGVPSVWFEEALSARFLYNGDIVRGSAHMAKYDKTTALSLLELYMPSVFFLERAEANRQLGVWGPVMQSYYPSDNLCWAISHLFFLEDEIICSGRATAMDEEQHAERLETIDRVEAVLDRFTCQQASPLVLLPVTFNKRVSMVEMIAQAQELVQRLKMHLGSTESSRMVALPGDF